MCTRVIIGRPPHVVLGVAVRPWRANPLLGRGVHGLIGLPGEEKRQRRPATIASIRRTIGEG